MSEVTQSFEDFMESRLAAAEAYVEGNPDPLEALCAIHDPATFFAPLGGHVLGAEAVASRYREDDAAFEVGGTTGFEVLHQHSSGDLAYWVGLQQGNVKFKGREPISMTLRITEIFRLEDDGWKLIHRHADSLAEPKTPRG